MVFQILGKSMYGVESTLAKGLSQPRRSSCEMESTLAKRLSLESYLSLREAAGCGLTSSI